MGVLGCGGQGTILGDWAATSRQVRFGKRRQQRREAHFQSAPGCRCWGSAYFRSGIPGDHGGRLTDSEDNGRHVSLPPPLSSFLELWTLARPSEFQLDKDEACCLPVNPDAFNQGARAGVMGSRLLPSLYPQDSGPTRTANFARDTCAFPFWTRYPVNPLPRSSKALTWVPSKFFLPLAHLNQNSLSLSPQLIRSDYLIKLIRTEVWMRPNPPGGICILKEERVNPNASTISGMCGETFWGAGSFPVPPASQAIPSLGEPMDFPHQRNWKCWSQHCTCPPWMSYPLHLWQLAELRKKKKCHPFLEVFC